MVSGTNGFYCKIHCGVLIQWGFVRLTTGTTKGELGYYAIVTQSFHTPFISGVIATVCSVENSAGFWNAQAQDTSTTSTRISVAGDLPSTQATVRWIAIGRWK